MKGKLWHQTKIISTKNPVDLRMAEVRGLLQLISGYLTWPNLLEPNLDYFNF